MGDVQNFLVDCNAFPNLDVLRRASVYRYRTLDCVQISIIGRHRAFSMTQFSSLFLTHPAAIKPWSMAIFPGGNPGNNSGNNPKGNPGGKPASSLPLASSSSKNPPHVFSLFSANPTLGLFLLSPLVPASDNKPALALLTAIQFLFGLLLMARRMPKIGESRFHYRTTSALRFLLGSVGIVLCGIEMIRFVIPYDPWAEEAKAWRKWAVKNGHNPSWWYGGIAFYTPMSISKWKVKTTTWITNISNSLEHNYQAELTLEKALEGALEGAKEGVVDLLSSIPIGPRAVLRAGESNTYNDIYEKLRAKNCQRSKDLLEGDLKEMNELNKAARIDAILENKGHVHVNEEYSKPSIQLGTHGIDTDEDFEMVWANFEPWDELRQETGYDVRLIPRWRCIDGDLAGDLAKS